MDIENDPPSPAGMAEVEAAVKRNEEAWFKRGCAISDKIVAECRDARTALLDLILPLFRPAPDMAEIEAAVGDYGEAEVEYGVRHACADAGEKLNISAELRTALLDLIARHRSAPGAPAVRDNGLSACGHPSELMRISAETGEELFCELCDARSRARDGEAMEAHWRAKYEAEHEALRQARAEVWERAAKIAEEMPDIVEPINLRELTGADVAAAVRAAAKAEEAGS